MSNSFPFLRKGCKRHANSEIFSLSELNIENYKVFWHQSEARTAATVWNWSGKTLSPGALLAVLYFSSVPYFPPV